jgi:hypothetical protein
VVITTTADRRSSKGSSPDHTAAIRFDAREHEPFQPEDTISIVSLLVRSQRLQAKPAPGTLNSPSLGPLDLASVLSSILPKDPKYGHRAKSRPGSKVRPSCRRDQALIVNPVDEPQNRNRAGKANLP